MIFRLNHIRTTLATLCVSCILLIPLGCGGGTSGSGLQTISGNITSTLGAKLGGVQVTVENTGDTGVSNAKGQFEVTTDSGDTQLDLLLESPKFISRYRVASQRNSRSSVAIQINTDTDEATGVHLSLSVGVVGLCDYYFENTSSIQQSIRQSNRVPADTTCSLNVELLGDGQRLADFPVVLEYSRCEENSPWYEVAAVRTGVSEHAGSAEIDFVFQDSADFCRYRVRPIVDGTGFPMVSYPIDTFTEQGFFKTK